MNKLNFLRPDIENLNTYLYSGIFLIFIAILDVSINSFFGSSRLQLHFRTSLKLFSFFLPSELENLSSEKDIEVESRIIKKINSILMQII